MSFYRLLCVHIKTWIIDCSQNPRRNLQGIAFLYCWCLLEWFVYRTVPMLSCQTSYEAGPEKSHLSAFQHEYVWGITNTVYTLHVFLYLYIIFTRPNMAYCGCGPRSLAGFFPVRPRSRFFPLVFNFYMTDDRMFWYSEPRSKILQSIWGALVDSLPIHIPVSLFDICSLRLMIRWRSTNFKTFNDVDQDLQCVCSITNLNNKVLVVWSSHWMWQKHNHNQRKSVTISLKLHVFQN